MTKKIIWGIIIAVVVIIAGGVYYWSAWDDRLVPAQVQNDKQVETGTSTVKITTDSVKITPISKTSIEVVSPDGGEKWQIGNTYMISVAVKGDLGRRSIRLVGYSVDGKRISEKTIGITDEKKDVNTFLFTVPSDTKLSSNYKIEVVADAFSSPLGYSDESDTYFSIIK